MRALLLSDSRGAFGNGSDKRLLCERGGGSSWSNARTKGCCATAKANRAINGPGRVAFRGDRLKLGGGEQLYVIGRGG